MKKIVIFDVCWTLFKTSTTFSFVDFSLLNLKKKSYIHFFLKINIVKYFLILIGRFFKFDLYRYIYIYLLKGIHKDDLEILSEKYIEEYLVLKKINKTFELLNYYSESAEFDIFLSSASLDVIIKPLAIKLKLKYHASNLGFDDLGFCTGLLDNDLLGNKEKQTYNVNEIYLVVTDNFSDLKLIRKSKNCFIISSRKNTLFWSKQNIIVDYFLD